MFAWLPRIIDRSGATAGVGSGHIEAIAVVALHQDHITRELIELGHLLRLLAVIEIGYQLLNRFPALGYRA